MNSILRSLAWFRPDWPRVALALGLLAITTAVGVLKPWPLAGIVDRLNATPSADTPSRLARLAVALFLVHALHQGLTAALNGIVISTGLRGLARVRRAIHDALLALSLRQFRQHASGDLIYRATWDAYSFQTLFNQGVFTLAGAILNVAAMTAVMWGFNPRLTGLALLAVPVLLVVMRLFGRALSERAAAARNADARLTARIQQTLTSLLMLQSFTAEGRERRRFAGETHEALRARWRQHRTEVAYLLAVGLVFAAATAALVWLGSGEVRAGRLTTGQLLVFLAYLAQLHEPLSQLTHVGATVTSARAGADRVLELLADRIPPDEGDREPDIASGQAPAIDFNAVQFAYETGHPVLRNVSFRIEPGQTVALVGPSGAGKSTLLHLVARFLDPDTGSVAVNGTDIRAFRVEALRSRIALVPQEPVLLTATVGENVALGRPEAGPDSVRQALIAARAESFIQKLPQGLDTPVGDGADRLSVGERQRVSLARAFLKDAPILLLDEPTSALDAENESAVMRALSDLRRGRTTLMVTHRPATLRDADRVLVLVDGRLVGDGTPSELISRGGWFADWCRSEIR